MVELKWNLGVITIMVHKYACVKAGLNMWLFIIKQSKSFMLIWTTNVEIVMRYRVERSFKIEGISHQNDPNVIIIVSWMSKQSAQRLISLRDHIEDLESHMEIKVCLVINEWYEPCLSLCVYIEESFH